MSFLPPQFSVFCGPECDRTKFLQRWLMQNGLQFRTIPLNGRTHIMLQFPASSYNPMFRTKTLLVHYDRAENTPGANDNSAAVYMVMEWAKRLMLRPGVHNMRIIFTDGEESCMPLSKGADESQGALGLAMFFKKLGILHDDVYVLDSMGRGDVLVVSTAGKNSPGNLDFQKQFKAVFERACDLCRQTSPESWLTLPVPYSDNAGFLACGFPAVAITMLPREEADVYIRQLQRDPSFEADVMNRTVGSKLQDRASQLMLNERIPRTWRIEHTPLDNEMNLTPESFDLTAKLLDNLADLVVMA